MSRPSSTAAGSAGRAGIAFAAVCVVTLLAYARSFGSPFQFDDNAQIVGNRILAAPSVQGLLGYGQARILPFATLALNYQLGGENPFSYHVVNFVVHLLATFAVFQLALALCRSPRMRDSWVAGEAVVFATAAALFFACHPIQVQAVTYVVQRMSSMAALFYVGCVLLYVRARNAQLGLDSGRYRVAFAFSLLLALAAFFSKENTASLPIAILLVELVFYPTAGGRGRLLRLAPFAALALAIPLTWGVRGRGPGYRPDAAQPLLEQTQDLVRLLFFRASPGLQISPLDYLLTQAVVIPRYLALVVLPWGFNVDHDVPIVAALSGQVLAGLALLVALFAVATHALRDAPVVGFGLLWLFVALSVESSFLPIRDPMVEHRMYLAMPGLALVGAWGLVWALRRRRTVTLAAGAAYLLVLVSVTWARNEVWRSPVTLWQDALAKSPNKPRAHANLATALHRAGRADEAVAHFCMALRLDPEFRTARDNLDLVMEERIEKLADAGEEVEMEAVIGPDGSMQFKPLDPCPRALQD